MTDFALDEEDEEDEEAAASAHPASRREAGLLPLVVAVAATGVYLLTLTHNFTDGEDALEYVRHVTVGEDPWRYGNHLLFIWVCRAWYGIWIALGHGGDALLPMQVLSAVSAGASVGLTAWLGRLIGLTRGLAVSAAIGLAVSCSFWVYGVLPDTYVLPISFVLFGFACLLRTLRPDDGGSPTSWVVAAAFSWSIATLLHQQNVLFFGAGALMLLFEHPARRGGWWRAVLLLSVGCALVLGTYVLVALIGEGKRSIAQVFWYTLGHAGTGMWTPSSWLSIPKGVVGLLRSVFTINLALGVEEIAQTAHRILPNILLAEERYFAGFLAPAVFHAALAGMLASAAASLALIVMLLLRWRSGRSRKSGGTPQRGIRIALWLGAMIASQAIPVIVWEPINPEFWIAALPWAWLLLAISVRRYGDRRVRAVWFGFIALLGTTNAIGQVIPQTDPRSDYWRQANAMPLSLLKPGDQMVSLGGYLSDGYLSLKSRRLVYSGALGIGEVHRRILATPPESRILVSSWLLDPPAFLIGNVQLSLWDHADAVKLLDCYRPNLERLGQSSDQTVWQLRRPVPACPGI